MPVRTPLPPSKSSAARQSTFGMHDRTRFEVFLYALNPDDDSVQRRRMEDEVEHFRDLSLLTAREAAAAIADDG